MVPRLFLLLSLVVLSCGGYRPPPLGACSEGVPLDDEPCAAGSFVATDRCFASLPAACDCLACPKSRCQASDADPAEATCGTEEPPDKAKE
jgi:hypothetical protein